MYLVDKLGALVSEVQAENGRAMGDLAVSLVKRGPLLPENGEPAPATILKLADRQDRKAMIRFSSGHHYLLIQDWRRKMEARRNGNAPAIRCRACRSSNETELHVMFKCSYWKAVQLRNAFLTKIQHLNVDEASLAETVKKVMASSGSQHRVLARWIRHLLALLFVILVPIPHTHVLYPTSSTLAFLHANISKHVIDAMP